MSETPVLLDDIAIGQSYRTDTFLMTESSIKAFAREFDPQPMHIDDAAAAKGPFGKLTASGWQTLALAMRLMAEAKPFGSTPLVGVGVTDIRFLKPVFVDTTIFVDAEVTAKRTSSKPGRGFVTMQLSIKEKATDAVVVSEQWTVMVPSR